MVWFQLSVGAPQSVDKIKVLTFSGLIANRKRNRKNIFILCLLGLIILGKLLYVSDYDHTL